MTCSDEAEGQPPIEEGGLAPGQGEQGQPQVGQALQGHTRSRMGQSVEKPRGYNGEWSP